MAIPVNPLILRIPVQTIDGRRSCQLTDDSWQQEDNPIDSSLRPSAIDHRPSTIGHRPSAIGHLLT